LIVPRVLQAVIYAMAALVGAVILIVIRRLGIAATLAAVAGGVCCFVLRVVAGYFHWNLSRIANPQSSGAWREFREIVNGKCASSSGNEKGADGVCSRSPCRFILCD
jgi:hypothetical protein